MKLKPYTKKKPQSGVAYFTQLGIGIQLCICAILLLILFSDSCNDTAQTIHTSPETNIPHDK